MTITFSCEGNYIVKEFNISIFLPLVTVQSCVLTYFFVHMSHKKPYVHNRFYFSSLVATFGCWINIDFRRLATEEVIFLSEIIHMKIYWFDYGFFVTCLLCLHDLKESPQSDWKSNFLVNQKLHLFIFIKKKQLR